MTCLPDFRDCRAPWLAVILAWVLPFPAGRAAEPTPTSFTNDVIPALTKAGCNAGACHGSQYGKGGFKLSLLGYDPDADHAAVTRDLLGRRVSAGADRSLLLLKASGAAPHEGGVRLPRHGDDYATLLAWLRDGAPGPSARDPHLTGITIEPAEATLRPGDARRLRVTARYGDGTARDVTRWARFVSNHDNVASVSDLGEVKTLASGEAVIRAHFGAEVAVARLLVPVATAAGPGEYPAPANFVDEAIFAKLKRLGVAPSPVADDAAFLRRVTVDLIGLPPTPDEARAFLASRDPRKREKWIDALLERPEFVDAWAYKLGDLLRVSRRNHGVKGMAVFHRYLRDAAARDRRWDEVARELVTGRGSLWDVGPANYYGVGAGPEDWAETTSQVFLGVRIGCARCHNHPFDRWTRRDYYGFVAFFGRTKTKAGGGRGDKVAFVEDEGEVKHPKTGEVLPPRPLGGGSAPVTDGEDRREALARWLTAPENPWFARAAVNRVWKHLLGRGLVDPPDDMRATNPAANEEALRALAEHFVANDYALKPVLRALCRSKTYQLSSEPNATNRHDETHFARHLVRRLTAEQLLDALVQVTGVPERFPGLPPGTRAAQLPDTAVPSQFLDLFGRPARQTVCECEREAEPNLTQTLHVMNGEGVNAKVRAPGGRLAKLLASEKTDAEIVEELFLAALTRHPTPEERGRALAAVRDAPSRKEGFGDLLWALLNSRAFAFTH